MGGEKGRMNFEETELRLGFGFSGDTKAKINVSTTNANGKRGFAETHVVDLKLNLVSSTDNIMADDGVDQADSSVVIKNLPKEKNLLGGGGGAASNDPVAKPPAKAQVVGWPPVRSFRKNILSVQKSSSITGEESSEKVSSHIGSSAGAALVKVSLDGAPYLRKVDLKMYKSYQELSDALGKMFNSFTIGNCGSQGLMDFMNESKLMDLLNSSDYVPTYEDRDGDWMLVGDVPWEMLVGSCKRLRIMKGTEAIGLAPRAMEKCKNIR